MNAPIALWRVQAWPGERRRGLRSEAKEGEGRWRDKRAAGCDGCEVQKSLASRAIHILCLLAPFRNFLAIPPFLQPSLVHKAQFR